MKWTNCKLSTMTHLRQLEHVATYVARLQAVCADDSDTAMLYTQEFTHTTLISGGLNTLISLVEDYAHGCASRTVTALGASLATLQTFAAAQYCLELLHPVLVTLREHGCTAQRCRNINELQLTVDTRDATSETLASLDLLVVSTYLDYVQPQTNIRFHDALATLRKAAIQRQTWHS